MSIKVRRNIHSSSGRINLLGVLTLVAILSSILLYFSNEREQEKIENSYCGEFGFYGQQLTLMKDGTFKFRYNGCSQANGYLSGTWTIKNKHLLIYPEEPDVFLDSEYTLETNQLVPINNDNDKFRSLVLCKDYTDFWEEENESQQCVSKNAVIEPPKFLKS